MQKAIEDINNEFRMRLRDEFSRRLRVNERYSIRAFAKQIGVDSSTLSQIMAGKRQLSEPKIRSFSKKLGLPGFSPKTVDSREEFSRVSLDTFSIISDWYHFAILDLTLLKGFKSNPKWIARKLGISEMQATGAIERLQRTGMLKYQNGRLARSESFYTNYSEGTTSAALKEYQRQIIKKALIAVDSCPQDRKDITSMTIAADSKKLKAAKDMIKEFRRELCEFLERGEKDSVFHLAVQLYPVTEIEN